MAKKVKNKKLEFGALIKELESHECHLGSYVIEVEDVISSICHNYDCQNKVVDYDKLKEFLSKNRESISYWVHRNLGWYESEIMDGVGEEVWDEFGEEILKTCSPNPESNNSKSV